MQIKKAIKKNRDFGLVVGGVLIIYAAIQYFLKDKNTPIVAAIGLCLVLLAWLKPYWLTPLQIAWEKIGFVMGLVNTYVLLTAFYYLLLTPIAFIRRLTAVSKKSYIDSTNDTYWQAHSVTDNDHFKNQY